MNLNVQQAFRLMKSQADSKPKINIFAFPSQTTIIFALIVVTLLGAVFTGSIGSSPICIWPLALGMLLLPLRAFLERPERDFAKYDLSPAGEDLIKLCQVIEANSKSIGLRRVPQLVISPNESPLYTFGSFRRWYIAISHKTAVRMQEQLSTPETSSVEQAKLIHELYHFKTGDYWQLGYAGELLRLTFLFMVWAVTLLVGLGIFLILTSNEFLQMDFTELFGQVDSLTPEMRQVFIDIMPTTKQMAELRQQAEGTNLSLVLSFIASAFFPFIVIGGILWGFYWSKLWRMREFYADAGVVHVQGEVMPYLSALMGLLSTSLHSHSLSRMDQSLDQARFWDKVKGLLKQHPDFSSRIAYIRNPEKVFGQWFDTAVMIGVLALLLDMLLASPLTLIYIGNWPMHFVTLMIVSVISLYIIPYLVYKTSIWPDIFKIVGFVMTLRFIWLVLTVGLMVVLLVVSPDTLDWLLKAAIANVAHYAGRSDNLGFDDPTAFIVEAAILNFAQVFIILFVVLATLALVTFLLRRLLTWYSFPNAERRLINVAYLMIAWITICLLLTVLPTVTALLLEPSRLLNPLSIVVQALGIISVLVGAILFFRADKQYARYCPKCGVRVTGDYKLGKTCENCGALLHPWMIAEYEL